MTGPPESAPPPPRATLALVDIVRGAHAFHLWGLLGWQDIRRRYRRSRLGPLWLTISMGILVAVLGMLYGALWDVEISDYAPFLALGFIVWGLISAMVVEGCSAFIGSANIIKQVSLPLSVHVYRIVWRNLIILFHNAAIFVVVAIMFSVWPGWAGILALPGLMLLCLNGAWMGLLTGLVSARYRDVPPIVNSIMRVAVFVTPVIWMPELLPQRTALLDFNPFFHLLELVRAPLLGQVPAAASWLAVAGMTFTGWLVTFALFCRYRWRVSYWV